MITNRPDVPPADPLALHPPAMAKFNCGVLSALGPPLAGGESLVELELEGKDHTFLRGALTGWHGGLFTGLLVVGHHL